jgi:flagellar motor switch protein FliG
VLAVVDMLNAAAAGMRKALLDSIAKKDPALGAAVRERIFLFEDLAKLSQADLSRVISQVQLQDLALSLVKETAEFRARVKAVLPELSWKVLQEETEHRGATASEQKIGEAQDRIVRTVYKLVREGQVAPAFLKLPGVKGA